ncbi:universal stress protein [Streptomyces sp. NPDC048419]|uniref:universal stress protein n=1 Tax=Streptomyces sp. NPDC048419 TaxID=3365547 RepID=UPI00371B90E0
MLPLVIADVDGSAESLAAAQGEVREAERRDRPLQLFHAWNWHPRQEHGEGATAAQRHLARRSRRAAEDRVRRTCPEVRLAADVQVEGPATAALLKAGEETDLLVPGSRGPSGLTGFLVGSVAPGVVARPAGPVVLVRAGEEAADEHLPDGGESGSKRTGYRDVVRGIDVENP